MNRYRLIAAATMALTILAKPALGAEADVAVGDCNRACLYSITDAYFTALQNHDLAGAPVTRHVKFTENGVRMNLGDGLWNTFTGRRTYNLRIADIRRGQVAVIDVIEEHGIPAILAARFRIANRQIVELETVVSRPTGDAKIPATDNLTEANPLWSTPLDPEKRITRERMTSMVNGYFDTLQLNNGTLFTQFTEDCNRIEDGLLITNNPAAAGEGTTQLGCADQFRLGQYAYDDRVRDRRYPLVDEEMGVVLAMSFIDHTGKVTEFQLTDGTPQKSTFLSPHSSLNLELFKIEGNAIRRVESISASMPYNMPSVW